MSQRIITIQQYKDTIHFPVDQVSELQEKGQGLWANIRRKRKRGEQPAQPGDADYPDPQQWKELTQNNEQVESQNYMFWQNLNTIHHSVSELLQMDRTLIDSILSNHAWAVDHLATSMDDVEEVYHFLLTNLNHDNSIYVGNHEGGYEDEYGFVEDVHVNESEYQGKEVELNKPMRGDVKKFKVYVKNAQGKVIKVNFGSKDMEIKRDNPQRRKSFRARHRCSDAKDRTTPRYWSCKMWSTTPVSQILNSK